MEEQVTFAAGGIVLEGLLSLPVEPARIGAVVCHPHPLYGGDMHNNVVTALVDAFRSAGMATLRFNFRGVGSSGGDHGGGEAEIADVEAAVGFLVARSGLAKVAVAGYSFGSMVGLRAGASDARVNALIGVALPIATRDASFLDQVSKPTLLISGDRDDYSPVPKLQALAAATPAQKQLTILAGVDHFFRGGSDDEAAAAAAAFLQKQRT